MHKNLNFKERFYLEKRIILGNSNISGYSRKTIYIELKDSTMIQIRQSKVQLVYLSDSRQAIYRK